MFSLWVDRKTDAGFLLEFHLRVTSLCMLIFSSSVDVDWQCTVLWVLGK